MEKRITLTDKQFEDLQWAVATGMTITQWINLRFPETVTTKWCFRVDTIIIKEE